MKWSFKAALLLVVLAPLLPAAESRTVQRVRQIQRHPGLLRQRGDRAEVCRSHQEKLVCHFRSVEGCHARLRQDASREEASFPELSGRAHVSVYRVTATAAGAFSQVLAGSQLLEYDLLGFTGLDTLQSAHSLTYLSNS